MSNLNLNRITEAINGARGGLFILCGYPYAGKSYVARELIARTGIALVSVDDIFHARGFDWSTNRLPSAEEWEEIFDESYTQAQTFIKADKNVLYDSTNHTRVSRDKLREVARSVEAESYVIYVRASVDEVWKRWEESTVGGKGRHVISRDLVATTIAAFEPPAESEGVFVVDN